MAENNKDMDGVLREVKINLRAWSSGVTYFVLSLLVFLMVVFQIPGEGRDWKNYNNFYDLLRIDGLDAIGASRFEPAFIIFSFFLTKLSSSNLIVYGLTAAGAIFLKFWTVNKLSPTRIVFFVAALFYLVRFAPLHELTQLRVACSAAFLMLAFIFVWEGNRVGGALACLAALAFHITAIIIIPPLLLMRYGSRVAVISVGTVTFVAVSFGLESVTTHFQDIFFIIKMYQEAGFGEETPNKLSPTLLLDWAMVAIGLAFWGRISPIMKHVLLLELIGLAIFYGALDFPVIAHRSREFISVFWIFFVAQGLQNKSLIKEFSILFVIANLTLYWYVFADQFFL
jgi:hypothetical protein